MVTETPSPLNSAKTAQSCKEASILCSHSLHSSSFWDYIIGFLVELLWSLWVRLMCDTDLQGIRLRISRCRKRSVSRLGGVGFIVLRV